MISGMGDARIVTLSLRVYSVLLASYPQSFRHEYAPHMLQAFGDYTRRVHLQRGLPGMLWWWTLTLFDFIKTVIEEHLQGSTYMTKEKFIRLGGWALTLTGFTMSVIFLNGIYADPFDDPLALLAFRSGFWLSLPFLLAIGFMALRGLYITHLGAMGNWALLLGIALDLFVSATILFAFITGNDPYSQLFNTSFVANMAVILLFGIDALKQNYLHGWKLLPLITGLIPLANSIVQRSIEAWPRSLWPLYRLLRFTPLVFSTGILLLGYMLLRELNRAQEPT